MEFSASVLDPYKIRHEWTIKNFGDYFNFIDEHESLTISSYEFRIDQRINLAFSFKITIFSGSIVCYLCRSPFTRYNKLMGELSLIKEIPYRMLTTEKFKINYKTCIKETPEHFAKLVLTSDDFLTNKSNSFFNGRDLRVKCVLTVLDVNVIIQPMYTPRPCQPMRDHFKQLLESENGSDIVFEIDNEEVKAHKSILLARSPVFAAMLKHDMVEKTTNRVKIVDISRSTFDLLLHFTYTDRIKSQLNVETGINLLRAASKYQLDGLQNQCTKQLFKLITTNNAEDIRVIAEDYNLIDFVKSIEGFVKSHPKPA